MATYQRNWGQAANTNNNGYGSGANNDIGWGSVHKDSYGHDETDLVGVPAIYVGNPDSPTGIGDPTNGTSTLLYRNRIEARPLWDATGTQLNDYSTSNNGGQIHSGGALDFDGVNDYVEVNQNIASALTELTFSAWVYFDAVGALQIIFDERDDATDGISAFLNASSQFVFRVNDTDSTTTAALSATTWYYLSATWDGSTIKTYINGVQDGSASYSGVISTTALAKFGQRAYASGIELGGDIAESQLNTRALSASEVLQNYNNPQQPITNGLEVWYDFNELDGLTLFDRSGNGNNASINGATWVSGVKEGYQPALGGFNNCETWDGSTNYVTLPSAVTTALSLSNAWTINAKAVLNKSADMTFISNTANASNDRVELAYSSSGDFITVTVWNGTSFATSFDCSSISDGSIVEIQATNDGSLGTSITVNGVAGAGTDDIVGANTVATVIGANSGATTRFFNGIIDYVEVEGIGRWSNLGGWVDEIGTNDGTVNGSPTTARIAGPTYDATTDIFGNEILNPFIPSALNFSGGYSGLYVDAGANVDTTTDFSYVGWHYLDGVSAFDVLHTNRTNGIGQELACLDIVAGSTYEIRFRNDNGSNNDVTTTTDLSYGTWYFVAACYTSAGDVNIYAGTKDATPTRYGNGNFSAPESGSLNMTFTNRPDGSVNFGGYELYEVMYAEDLSSANTDLDKIEQIWNATKSLVP